MVKNLLLLIGFLLISGGYTLDTVQYNLSEISPDSVVLLIATEKKDSIFIDSNYNKSSIILSWQIDSQKFIYSTSFSFWSSQTILLDNKFYWVFPDSIILRSFEKISIDDITKENVSSLRLELQVKNSSVRRVLLKKEYLLEIQSK
jgi:hypothetical protein